MRSKTFLVNFVFIIALFFIGCNKPTTELQAESQVDKLFNLAKDDTLLFAYMSTVKATTRLMKENIIAHPFKDTLIRRKYGKMPLKILMDSLGYTGYDKMSDLMRMNMQYYFKLSEKYPILVNFSKEESREFFRKIVAYYNGRKSLYPKVPLNQNSIMREL